jgi:hypothetical protein
MKYKPTKEQIMGIIRHTLTIVAGGFIASGVMTEVEIMEGIGYIMGTIGFLWSVFKNKAA